MTTKTHTYSDGSQIELGPAPGKGWVGNLKTEHRTPARQVIGRKAIRVTPDQTTRPDREF